VFFPGEIGILPPRQRRHCPKNAAVAKRHFAIGGRRTTECLTNSASIVRGSRAKTDETHLNLIDSAHRVDDNTLSARARVSSRLRSRNGCLMLVSCQG
jgi:hypothetical protein